MVLHETFGQFFSVSKYKRPKFHRQNSNHSEKSRAVRVEEGSTIKKFFFGLFNNENGKSLSLELKEGNDVVEEYFEVL